VPSTPELTPLLAFIPSPADGVLEIGPLPLHAYGLMLALGILAALKIAEWRWTRQGGDPKVIGEIFVPVVVAGILGARIYHLFTGYRWSEDGVVGAFKIWEGGLSIWGAVAGGLIAVVVIARVRHLDVLAPMDAIAPGLAVAQAIGRWGNWFNQELFGRPTELPWALEIDPAHRPSGYEAYETFHPTFLYESLWCLFVFGAIVWSERRFSFRKGQAFAMYVALYTFGRIWFEWLRIDDATRVFGIRFNLLLSVALCGFATGWFFWLGRSSERRSTPKEVDAP
jgi:prolipoprotein diacylglyceryl transferase